MIKIIRKIVFSLFKKFIPPSWIETAINEEKIKLATQNCTIGKNTIIIHDTRILNLQNNPNNIKIGDNCIIRGQLFINEYGGKITIGNYTFIGEFARIWSSAEVTIGNNVQISHGVNIIDNNTHSLDYKERQEEYICILKNGNIKQKGNISNGTIIIEDDVWISFNASILKGVTIGKGAVIASNTIVTKDVPAFTMVAGNPAKTIKLLQ